MMQKLIITVAVCGSRPTKAMNPAVPYAPAEIAAAAIESYWAGAAIAHIHVRDPQTGAPSSKRLYFQEVVDRIRGETDMVINLTTSGLNISGEDVVTLRLEPVDLGPEICSLDIGSVNFRDRLFANPPQWGEQAALAMKARGVKPEIEVFDLGHIAQAKHLINAGLIESPPYFQLCMGVDWGIPATVENLLTMQRQLPVGCQWSVLGVGRMQDAMVTMGILLGGHVRVGFEDNLYIRRHQLAGSNAEFVIKTVTMAETLQREVATAAEARQILGLSPLATGTITTPGR